MIHIDIWFTFRHMIHILHMINFLEHVGEALQSCFPYFDLQMNECVEMNSDKPWLLLGFSKTTNNMKHSSSS